MAGELKEIAGRGGEELIAVRQLRSPGVGGLLLPGQFEQLRDEARTIYPWAALCKPRGDQAIFVRAAQHRNHVGIAIEFKQLPRFAAQYFAQPGQRLELDAAYRAALQGRNRVWPNPGRSRNLSLRQPPPRTELRQAKADLAHRDSPA